MRKKRVEFRVVRVVGVKGRGRGECKGKELKRRKGRGLRRVRKRKR